MRWNINTRYTPKQTCIHLVPISIFLSLAQYLHEYMRNEIYELLLVRDLGLGTCFQGYDLLVIWGRGWKVISPEMSFPTTAKRKTEITFLPIHMTSSRSDGGII